MKNIILLFLLLFPLLSAGQTLTIVLGQQQKINSSRGPLWIEDKKILRGEVGAGHWILSALREGQTHVQAGNQFFRVQVIHPGKKKLWDELNQQLKKQIGLVAEIEGERLVVRGKIYRWEDWLNLASDRRLSDPAFELEAEIPNTVQEKALIYFNEKMKSIGLPVMKIHFGEPLELKISDTQEGFEKYLKIFHPFGIQVKKDKSAVALAPVVKLEMTILELNKNLKRKYGWSWPASFSAQIQPSFNWKDFTADLDALENQGEARILASPNLLSRSGEESSFLVGGEFPIKVTSRNSSQVIWKNYGISLKFKPRADSSGRMSISMESEVSSIDSSLMVDGVPALKNHRVSSHFDLVQSELVVLSGLIKNDEGQHSQGLPGLSSLPVLGSLFGSQDFHQQKTELVILVRPQVLNSFESSTLQHLKEQP